MTTARCNSYYLIRVNLGHLDREVVNNFFDKGLLHILYTCGIKTLKLSKDFGPTLCIVFACTENLYHSQLDVLT